MKKIVALIMLTLVSYSYAQKDRTLKLNKDMNLIEVIYYHDNGEISQTGYYTTEGKLHGEWYSYCLKGNKLVAAKYDNGVKTGTWFFWNDDRLREVNYANGDIAEVSEWRSAETAIASNN